MLKILLTYDYELFFNDCTFSEKEVLIEPTENIMNCLDNCGVKGSFFVDIPSVIRYKQLGMFEYPTLVKKQVNRLLNLGHDIQLHIHPIWYQAIIHESRWKFDNNYYMLSAYKDVDSIIKECKAALDDLCKGNPFYHCTAFRAGGFCLSPEQQILSSLFDCGIRIDSSVYPRTRMATKAQRFNYSDIKGCHQWMFEKNKGIRSTEYEDQWRMLEIPVGIFHQLPQKWILTHGVPRLHLPPSKGKPTPTISIRQENGLLKLALRIKNAFFVPVLFTMDTLHEKALTAIVENYRKKLPDDENHYLCAIAHPKFSSEESVENMRVFIQKAKVMDGVKFVTMKDVYGENFGRKDAD